MLINLLEDEVALYDLTYSKILLVYRNIRESPEGITADIAIVQKGKGIAVNIDNFIPLHIAKLIAQNCEILTEEQVQARVAAFMGVPVHQEQPVTSIIKGA